jgi:hypothetical protein
MIIKRDEAFKVVCNIRTRINNQDVVGTGIFVSKGQKAFLITATHVAASTNASSYIIYCDSSNNPITRNLSHLNFGLSWKNHSTADLSVLEIEVAKNLDLLDKRCFPFDHIEGKESFLSRDIEITCVGFPNGLGVSGRFSPFTFRSYISSGIITLNRADTKTPSDFFCLESPSIGGYSGGPVFDLGYQVTGAMTTTKDKTRLLGIMHGTISDNTGGKIAAVTPAKYILEII